MWGYHAWRSTKWKPLCTIKLGPRGHNNRILKQDLLQPGLATTTDEASNVSQFVIYFPYECYSKNTLAPQ
jgi:hypothetical protein